MAKRKAERVRVEQLSRNPRPSRQAETLSGKPLVNVGCSFPEMRKAVGMSQAQLAQAAGIPGGAIANVEAGRYVLSASNGIKIFAAIARAASPQSLEYREAKRAALELVAFQKELYRKSRLAAQGVIKAQKKKLREIKSGESEIESEEARLREL